MCLCCFHSHWRYWVMWSLAASQGVHSISSGMKLWSSLPWGTKEKWELYIIQLFVFSFGMYLQCKSIPVSQCRLMLLWCHKDKPKWTRIRGEIEAINLLRKQVAEPVTESSCLGLIYSLLAGSELVIENEQTAWFTEKSLDSLSRIWSTSKGEINPMGCLIPGLQWICRYYRGHYCGVLGHFFSAFWSQVLIWLISKGLMVKC